MTIFNPVDLSGSVSLGGNPAAGTDPGEVIIGGFLKIVSKDILLPVGGSAVASVNLGFDFPVGAIIIYSWGNIEAAITGAGGATAIALGITGDEDKYKQTSTLVKNAKFRAGIGGFIVVSPLEDLEIFAVNGSGVPTGTIQNGTVRIHLAYFDSIDLPNA